MNRKQKKNLIRILISAALLILLHALPVTGVLRFVLYMIPYFIISYDILLKAFHGIRHRQPFDESLLMTIATLGAITLALYTGSGDYIEAIAVMLFYQIGEWFQSYAVGKSRKNIADLMDIRPDYAYVEDDAGELLRVDPDDVAVGTVITVQKGERIPIDGVVVEGASALNTAALTGESLPREVKAGDEALSGCINMTALLKIRTTKEYGASTASRILELIEDASARKSRSEDFISRFARVYTPVVVYAALALAVLPPVFLLLTRQEALWGTWLYRALTFLVISCPCALVISIPLSFFAGIGSASRAGILVKGSNYLEALSETRTVAFDKTGTLTTGSVQDVMENGVCTGQIVVADALKPHAKEAVQALRKAGVKKTVVLTGDTAEAAEKILQGLPVDAVYAGLLPADKVTHVEQLLAEKAGAKERVAFVGDGINDAPVLARADIGIAMGALGTDAAIEAADVVLMDDDPLKIVTAIRISRKCLRIVKENIYLAIGIKVLCLILGALGLAGMWAAIFADVGVMILAVLNAIRCLRVPS